MGVKSRIIVHLPPGLYYEVQDIRSRQLSGDIPEEEAEERLQEMLAPYVPPDYNPNTETIELYIKRYPHSQVPRKFGTIH